MGEISQGFLLPEARMAKRLIRAKQKIKTNGIPLFGQTERDPR